MNRHPNESWAATHALDAILGEHGVDAPAVSAAGWLKTLLDEIDASPEIKRILERDDPDSMREMLHECREMSDGLMTALLLMVPPDEANLGYQACVELEREIRADGIAEGDTITITRNDQGDEAGYQLIHDRLGDGLDCWSFDNLGQPILSHTAERV